MPELPDLRVFARYLDATSLHQTVRTVHLPGPELVEGVAPSTLRRHLLRHRLEETRRWGKHLFARLSGDGGWLRLHFGMTGYPDYGQGPAPEHTRLQLDFPQGRRLCYVNPRKLGEVGWVEDVESFARERDLGPDALSLTAGDLGERLEGRRGSLKAALMNQSILAGLGNVYVDEILFQAGLHPEAEAGGLGEETISRLHRLLRKVVDRAVEAGAEVEKMPRTWLLPHREEGASCPRCEGTIRRLRVSGRSTYLCSRHQRRRH